MVSDLVMVTAPKPPGSRQLISPPAAVFEIAPANVLHGAVRLHGLTSSPTPETQVRVACAEAGVTQKPASMRVNRATRMPTRGCRRIELPPLFDVLYHGFYFIENRIGAVIQYGIAELAR